MQRKVFIPEGLTVNHPFFYIIKHTPSGKYYAGCKYGSNSSKGVCDSSTLMSENGYRTSSKLIHSMISADGLDSFKIMRIRHFLNGKDSLSYERKFLHRVDAMHNQHVFINKTNGGTSFRGNPHSEKTKQKIRETQIGMKSWTDGMTTVRSKECPGIGFTYGNHLKGINENFSKSKMGLKFWNNKVKTIRAKQCPGIGWYPGSHRSKELSIINSESRKGFVWYTNGKIETMSINCPNGEDWKTGRLPRIISDEEMKNRKASLSSLRYWNNGLKLVRSKDCPGEGFVRGWIKSLNRY